MTASSEVAATTVDKTGASDAAVEDAASTARSTATVPEVERPANQLDDHWDSGLRARVEALAEEWNDQANQLTRQADEATERREFAYVSFWLGKADSYAGTAAQLRRALGGEQ